MVVPSRDACDGRGAYAFSENASLGNTFRKKDENAESSHGVGCSFGQNACGNVVGNDAVGLLSEELPVGLIFFRVQRVFLTTSA